MQIIQWDYFSGCIQIFLDICRLKQLCWHTNMNELLQTQTVVTLPMPWHHVNGNGRKRLMYKQPLCCFDGTETTKMAGVQGLANAAAGLLLLLAWGRLDPAGQQEGQNCNVSMHDISTYPEACQRQIQVPDRSVAVALVLSYISCVVLIKM